jgi:ribonuclease J
MLVQTREIDDFPDHKLVVISTGSQGEPLSALRRMAHRDHPQVELHDGRHGRLLGHARSRQRARGQRDDRPALPHRLRRDHDRDAPIHASGHGYARSSS